MRYRQLGRTGITVSEIGFGAWGIGGAMWQGSDDERSLSALSAALDAGCTFIDTALAYGNGHSERLIARVLATRTEPVAVASKIPPKNQIWPARPGVPSPTPSPPTTCGVPPSGAPRTSAARSTCCSSTSGATTG